MRARSPQTKERLSHAAWEDLKVCRADERAASFHMIAARCAPSSGRCARGGRAMKARRRTHRVSRHDQAIGDFSHCDRRVLVSPRVGCSPVSQRGRARALDSRYSNNWTFTSQEVVHVIFFGRVRPTTTTHARTHGVIRRPRMRTRSVVEPSDRTNKTPHVGYYSITRYTRWSL